jgi:hypothetical protein
MRAFRPAGAALLAAAAVLLTSCAPSSPTMQAMPTAPTPAATAGQPGAAAVESDWPPAPVVPLPFEPPPSLVVDAPLPDQLAKGLVVIRYRAVNLRIVPVFGPNALDVSPRIGHIHVTVDNAPWHWADASGEPLIIQFLPPGPHTVWIGLADPTHRVLDSRTIKFVIPAKTGA